MCPVCAKLLRDDIDCNEVLHFFNSMMMAVMLSAPSPSVVCKLGGQFTSIIISTTVARPLNLLLFIAFSNLVSSLFFVPLRGGDLPAAAAYLPLPPVLVGLLYGV